METSLNKQRQKTDHQYFDNLKINTKKDENHRKTKNTGEKTDHSHGKFE
jgi:hypothetical protein